MEVAIVKVLSLLALNGQRSRLFAKLLLSADEVLKA
jgi:hypothetical protein